MSRGSSAILVTRPLASTILALAVAVAVLPAIVPHIRARLRGLSDSLNV